MSIEKFFKQLKREDDATKFWMLSDKLFALGIIILFVIFTITNDVAFYVKLITLGIFWIIHRLFDLQKAIMWIMEDLNELKSGKRKR